MVKTIASTTPTTFTTSKGETYNLVHVVYSDGSTESVEKDSIYDPTSANYNPVIDAE